VPEMWEDMTGKFLLPEEVDVGGSQGVISFYSWDNLVGSCSHPSGYLRSCILTASRVPTLALVQPHGK